MTLVCVATHYEGEPCDNTVKFHKWVKSLKTKPFSNLKFSIFGLGDTAYEQFNAMGKLFDTKFEALGGTRVWDMGVGNSDNLLTEGQFDEWRDLMWPGVISHYKTLPGGDKV